MKKLNSFLLECELKSKITNGFILLYENDEYLIKRFYESYSDFLKDSYLFENYFVLTSVKGHNNVLILLLENNVY